MKHTIVSLMMQKSEIASPSGRAPFLNSFLKMQL